MKKLLILASLLATTACTSIPESTVQRAFKIALAAEKAALLRCPKEGTERRVFLAGRKLFDVAFGDRISPAERADLASTRSIADDRCGFTFAEAEAAAASLE